MGKILKLNPEEISQARARLIAAELILHRYPLYQVLSLPQLPQGRHPSFGPDRHSQDRRGGEPVSIGEFLDLAKKHFRNPDDEQS
jgi:hypothetical protein